MALALNLSLSSRALLGGAGTPPVTSGILTAAAGIFVLTGEAMAPIVDRIVTAAQATFTQTAVDAAFLFCRVVPAAQATFTLTGIGAALTDTPAPTGRQFADIGIYFNAGTSRNFANIDHYVGG